jgi:hypothetical protein
VAPCKPFAGGQTIFAQKLILCSICLVIVDIELVHLMRGRLSMLHTSHGHQKPAPAMMCAGHRSDGGRAGEELHGGGAEPPAVPGRRRPVRAAAVPRQGTTWATMTTAAPLTAWLQCWLPDVLRYEHHPDAVPHCACRVVMIQSAAMASQQPQERRSLWPKRLMRLKKGVCNVHALCQTRLSGRAAACKLTPGCWSGWARLGSCLLQA